MRRATDYRAIHVRRRRAFTIPLALGALAVALAGGAGLACSKRGGSSPGTASGEPAPAHVSGTPHTGDVIDAIKKAGLRAEGFALPQPTPFGASYCEQGRVEGIDTLVCEFPDIGTLTQGKRLVQDQWGREGVQTGVATAAQQTLLGVADRGHHDPNGKTISRILAAFKTLQKN